MACTTRYIAFLVSTFARIQPKGRFIRRLFSYLDGYNHESALTTMPRTYNKYMPVQEY